MHAWSKGIVGGLACGLVALAQAATITHVSPQGEVASVQQVAIRFFTGVVTLGDARAIDPAVLTCEGVVPQAVAAGRATASGCAISSSRSDPAPRAC